VFSVISSRNDRGGAPRSHGQRQQRTSAAIYRASARPRGASRIVRVNNFDATAFGRPNR